jgi:hypothetical protein
VATGLRYTSCWPLMVALEVILDVLMLLVVVATLTVVPVIVMYGKFQWRVAGIMSALEIADVFLGWLTGIQEVQ